MRKQYTLLRRLSSAFCSLNLYRAVGIGFEILHYNLYICSSNHSSLESSCTLFCFCNSWYTAEQELMTLGNQSCSQLPAGHTRKRGLLPRSGGMRSPFGRGSSQFGRRRWRWQPTFPWEEPFLQTAAIRQAKTVTFLYCGSLKFTSEIKKTTYIGDYNLETSWNMRTGSCFLLTGR